MVLDPGEYCIGRRGESCEFQVRKWNERSRHTFLFRADAEEEDGITDKLSQCRSLTSSLTTVYFQDLLAPRQVRPDWEVMALTMTAAHVPFFLGSNTFADSPYPSCFMYSFEKQSSCELKDRRRCQRKVDQVDLQRINGEQRVLRESKRGQSSDHGAYIQLIMSRIKQLVSSRHRPLFGLPFQGIFRDVFPCCQMFRFIPRALVSELVRSAGEFPVLL